MVYAMLKRVHVGLERTQSSIESIHSAVDGSLDIWEGPRLAGALPSVERAHLQQTGLSDLTRLLRSKSPVL